MADYAEIHDDEAAAVGVTLGMMNWGDLITPLLVAKGLPESDLWVGNPNVKITRDDTRKVTAFRVYRRG